MRPDYIALHHIYRAKPSGQSRAEYAAAIQGYKRPLTWRARLGYVAAALLFGASLFLLGVR